MHPVSDADPFSPAFFNDPFPVHAALRDAGPAVWLTCYGISTVARHAEVRTVLLSAMARRTATLEITAEPVRRHNNTLRALASLPLRVTAA